MKFLTLIALLFIAPTALVDSPHARFRVVTPDSEHLVCSMGEKESLDVLLPCAWRQARWEVSRRFAEAAPRVAELSQPPVHFRQGRWYDPDIGDYVYGLTHFGQEMLIEVGITGDAVNDYDTAVHEYKHFIVESVGLGPEAHNWVEDSSDGDTH